ncbi:MAG: response regulator [Chthonomonadales bacterium]
MGNPPPPGLGTAILVVDDEQMLVELLHRILERDGWDVLEATSASIALELFEANRDRIALVLTDLVMPNMSGRLLAEELIAKYPGLPVLISTGYSSDEDIQFLLRSGVKGIVQKPYRTEDLLKQILAAVGE